MFLSWFPCSSYCSPADLVIASTRGDHDRQRSLTRKKDAESRTPTQKEKEKKKRSKFPLKLLQEPIHTTFQPLCSIFQFPRPLSRILHGLLCIFLIVRASLHFSGSIQLAMDIVFRTSTLLLLLLLLLLLFLLLFLLLLRLSLVIRVVREPAYRRCRPSPILRWRLGLGSPIDLLVI